MGKATRAIASEVANREAKQLRNTNAGMLGEAVVGTAAGRTATRVAEFVSGQHSVTGIASMLGIEVEFDIGGDANRGQYLLAAVSKEDRDIFGYQDLPKQLIVDVNRYAFRAIPDHITVGVEVKRLTGRIMNLLYATPTRTDDSLLERLAELNDTDPLFPDRASARLDELTTINGIVNATIFVTRAYLQDEAARQSTISQQLAVARGGAEALNG
jgi:hypothetical protein